MAPHGSSKMCNCLVLMTDGNWLAFVGRWRAPCILSAICHTSFTWWMLCIPLFLHPSSPYPFDFPLACFCDQKLFQSISPVLMTYLWRPVLPKNGCCDSYSRKKISLSVKPHETKIDAATIDRSVTCICNIPPSIHFRGKTHI